MPIGPTITDGDVMEITAIGELQGSTILNVFHYKVTLTTPPTDNFTFMNNALTEWRTLMWTGVGKWQALVTSDYVLESVRAQIVYPVRRFYISQFVGDAGTDLAPTVPSDTHIELALRTAGVGRGLTGNKKFTGLALSDLSGAFWSNAAQADWDTFAPNILTAITPEILNPLNRLVPIVWSRKRAADRREIVAAESRPEVRVEPSRRAFRGI